MDGGVAPAKLGQLRNDKIEDRDRLIVALDFNSVERAREMVSLLGDTVSFYKIGLTLQFSGGIKYARELIESGKKVFLDSKIYDIGEQARGAVESIDKIGVDFLTVHGSREILEQAVAGKPHGSRLKLFVVTVLTSLDDHDLRQMGYLCSVPELVDYRTQIAVSSGCDGVIASGLEAAEIKRKHGAALFIAVPGIRPDGSSRDDQKRVSTPYSAISNGADYLVVGRPITTDPRPAERAESIRRDIDQALNQRPN